MKRLALLAVLTVVGLVGMLVTDGALDTAFLVTALVPAAYGLAAYARRLID